MNKLPSEILIPIFRLLDDPQYLECVYVCQKWYDIISNNFLYKKLKFKNADNVYKAIDLFDRKRKFGELVEDLTIEDCELDLYSIISMPRQIPNLKILNWSETTRPIEQRRRTDVFFQDLPSKRVYSRELSKWKNIEKITADIERLPFVSMLLESTTLANLTSLSISFFCLGVDEYFEEPSLNRVRPFVKSIMKNIKSAPALEELELSHPVLDLDDMEELHAGTPNLLRIYLYCVAIGGGTLNDMIISSDGMWNINGVPIGQRPANKVKHVTIEFYLNETPASMHNIDEDLKEVMISWLTYIGCKYNSITYMSLKGWLCTYLKEIPEFEQPILKIINKLARVKTHEAFFYPVTRSVADALDNNADETLKNLTIYGGEIDEIETQLNHIIASRQAKTIRYLHMNGADIDIMSCPSFTRILSGLGQHFHSMVNLSLSCNMHYSAIVKVLQLLPNLYTLQLNAVKIDMGEGAPIVPTTKCNIHSLFITLECERRSTMYQVNQVMEFLIQSCPLLTRVMLMGNLPSNKGILRLCFFNHPNLRGLIINLKGVHYYTFPWVNGKQGIEWANYNEKVETKDDTGTRLHVDISWKYKPIELDLAKAPV